MPELLMNCSDLTRAALTEIGSKPLNDEIEHHMGVDREDPGYDFYDALIDAYDIAVDNEDRAIMTPARKVLIEIGCWRSITEEELGRMQTLGGKKFDFKLGGTKYVWSKHLK